ncbi:MAG TPA: FkbM family methyltransferase [Anaerolineales bacterium]|nr:FkbM family methyltransferase [Anaerolineales bacterium]
MKRPGFENLSSPVRTGASTAGFVLGLAASAARALPMPVKKLFYRVPWLSRLIRKTLNRAAPSGLTRVKVAAGGLAGVQLDIDLQLEKDYWLGTYEPELQAAIRDLVHPGMVVYDVGANIGYISLLFARFTGPRGKVYAFEALPANLERLKGNIQINALDFVIETVPAAVVDRAKPVRFLLGPSGGMGKADGSAGRKDMIYSGHFDVQGVSLDEFHYASGFPAPHVVKMDIEGGEVLALPGMLRLLGEVRPLLLLELHGPEAANLAWKTLTAAGYRLCAMAPGYPAIAENADLDWKTYLVAIWGQR